MIATLFEGLRDTPLFNSSIFSKTRWPRDLRMSKAAFANGPGAKRDHACLTADGIVLSFIGIILRPQLVIHAVFAAACR